MCICVCEYVCVGVSPTAQYTHIYMYFINCGNVCACDQIVSLCALDGYGSQGISLALSVR